MSNLDIVAIMAISLLGGIPAAWLVWLMLSRLQYRRLERDRQAQEALRPPTLDQGPEPLYMLPWQRGGEREPVE